MSSLFLCVCLNLFPVRDKLLLAEGSLTVIRKEKPTFFRFMPSVTPLTEGDGSVQ